MTATYDTAVAGGGLLGMATAHHLVRAGVSTVLVDRADAGRATDAGILSPETNSRDPRGVVPFRGGRGGSPSRACRGTLLVTGHGPTGPPKED